MKYPANWVTPPGRIYCFLDGQKLMATNGAWWVNHDSNICILRYFSNYGAKFIHSFIHLLRQFISIAVRQMINYKLQTNKTM